jgi:cytoskeletal protein RodZ
LEIQSILQIHSIEEITFGQDNVIARELYKQRTGFNVTIEVAAWSIGADPEELRMMEMGDLGGFADMERFRMVLLSYCDYLGLDPSPLVARLEVYYKQGWCVPQNLHSFEPVEIERTTQQRTFRVLIFAGILVLPLLIAWNLVRL